MLSVRIGDPAGWGLTFGGGEGSDGFFLDDSGLKGWFGGVDARGNTISREGQDGDYSMPSNLAPRFVTLKGLCLSRSPEYQEQHNDQLAGLFGSGLTRRVTVQTPKGIQWADGKLSLGTKPEFDPTLYGSIAQYALSLKFDDPRKYGKSKDIAGVTGQNIEAFHYGNFKATPTFIIAGNMPGGYAINGPNGAQFFVTAPVQEGLPHVIDMANGYLTVGGAVVFGRVGRSDVWTIPAGGKTVQAVVPISGGSATVVIRVRDTFL